MRLALALVALVGAVRVAAADGYHAKVPSLIGKTEAEANAIVKSAGFAYDVKRNEVAVNQDASNACDDTPADVPVGKIVCQSPSAGKEANKTATVMVVVKVPRSYLTDKELHLVIGLSIEQAKAKLAELGYVGKITVGTELHFVKDCGFDKVCSTEPVSVVHIDGDLTLSVNPKAKISAPPP